MVLPLNEPYCNGFVVTTLNLLHNLQEDQK